MLMVGDIVVAACKDHPLLRKKVRLEDLAAQRWVLPSHSAEQRKWLDKTFTDHGLPPPRVQIETNSPLTLPAMIARTPFLSFMQRHQLWPARADSPLRELKFATTTMRRHFGVIHREHAYLPPAARHVVALLLEDARRRNLKGGGGPVA
jgi:DNA-binding transcriptional LysR family regulator